MLWGKFLPILIKKLFILVLKLNFSTVKTFKKRIFVFVCVVFFFKNIILPYYSKKNYKIIVILLVFCPFNVFYFLSFGTWHHWYQHFLKIKFWIFPPRYRAFHSWNMAALIPPTHRHVPIQCSNWIGISIGKPFERVVAFVSLRSLLFIFLCLSPLNDSILS